MDSSFGIANIGAGLGGIRGLPTPEQLRAMLAKAEVAAFFRADQGIPDDLLRTAWHLHQVGTVRPQLQMYSEERQVNANAVSAHIFDLALQSSIHELGERLVTTFAAQISSIRGDKTPNASALGRRLPTAVALLATQPGQTSLELGCAFLTLDRRRTADLLRVLGGQEVELAKSIVDIGNTGLASAVGVIDGIRRLQRYLTFGEADELAEARSAFVVAANNQASRRDLDSRWVAAHLIDLCDDFETSSVWAILPKGTPPAVGRSMTLGDPAIITLWPPQIQLLTDPIQSPLQPDVRRSVLTFPTSAGKTLLAQLLIAHHLSVVGSDVCFVAPSHSLCREVRDGLDRRLWAIRRTIVTEGPLGDHLNSDGHVVVMTPEKLAARLRADEPTLLAQFGLFVFDEAHLVADESRGWNFETTLSRLHSLTVDTDHRIILLSAALGGTASVQSWLETGAPTIASSSSWRGPRRLHATYATRELSSTARLVEPTRKQRKPRQVTDLYGYLSLYVDHDNEIARRKTYVGQVERTDPNRRAVKQPNRAAKLLPVVRLAAQSGAVLTVHGTKKWAEDLAAEVAANRPDCPKTLQLVKLAEQRLGPSHGLVKVLRCGVAYHHAGLPADVQAEIEDAVREGVIDIICATSTLTEGVNLPVRTVIICERGVYDGDKFIPVITSAGLMNAAGRAGRAGRETEGWVIVNEQYGASAARDALHDLDRFHDINSTLNSDKALVALAKYEEIILETGRLALQNVPVEVDGFLSYCWYLAEVAGVVSATDRVALVSDGIHHTLAWHQLPESIRNKWELLGQTLCSFYENTDEVRRRRWAHSGARLSANLTLEAVAIGATEEVRTLSPAELADPVLLLVTILSGGRLEALLELVNHRDFRFKLKRYGSIELAEIDVLALVLAWVGGIPLADLAETYLPMIDPNDEPLRFEQLSNFIGRICEHHLPFSLGTLIDWIGAQVGFDLNALLPSHVYYGVPHAHGIELLKRGVRSRRLAVAVGDFAENQGVSVENLRSWIAGLGPTSWRREFEASPVEVADLFQYVHDPDAAISASLLDGEIIEIQVDAGKDPHPSQAELYLLSEPSDQERPTPLLLVTLISQCVARIRATEYRHLLVLCNAGFQLSATPIAWNEDGFVTRVAISAILE